MDGMRAVPAAIVPAAKYSAVSGGAAPAAPTAIRQRVTRRYLPISTAVVASSSRGVDCLYISRLISAIAARSRWVSAGAGTATAGAAGVSTGAGRDMEGAPGAARRGAPL